MSGRISARRHAVGLSDLEVSELTLENGLRLLVLPRPRSPIVACDLYYPAGSVDDPPGKSGLAHFVEHMLFKGTKRYPKGAIDRLTFLAAGQSNAETGEDLTHYWFALPAEQWELALEIESDRMAEARFSTREVDLERRVILAERARELDSPIARLDQAHLRASYKAHPYRRPILGNPRDLARITSRDLLAFYRRHYRPEKALLVMVGPLDPERVAKAALARFASLSPLEPASADAPIPPDPMQTRRRSCVVLESEGIPRGLLGWHTVPQSDPDKPALDVLSDILCCGRRSRLWHRLVEQDRLATWVDASHESARRGGQLLIQLEAPERRNLERIEAVIHDELQKLARHGPAEREMARSRARLDASWRWDKEDVVGIAAGIGQAGLWGDWRAWLAEHQRAMALDPAQIARVAQIYLRPNQLTAAWSIPERGHSSRQVSTSPTRARDVAVAANGHASGCLDPRLPWHPVPSLARARELATLKPHRTVLPNGLILLVEPRPDSGTVAIELHLDAGQLRERKPGLAALVGRMLEDGTRHRTAETLASEVEDSGGVLEAGSTGASLRFRREDLPLALELLADVITRPRFPADRLDWQRRRMIAEWRADRDEPALRADAEFRRLIYRNHPYARDPRGSAADVRRLTLDDIRDHHRQWFHARGAILAIAGDVEPQAVLTLVRKHLGDWRPAGTVPRPRQEAPSLIPPRRRHIPRASVQTQIILGHLGVRRADPAHDALLIVDHILGSGPGCADRLSRVLRDELALVYSVHGGITDSADLEPGLFRVTLGTPPSESQAANDRARELIAEVAAGRFSENEIAEAKTYLEGAWVFDYQTTGQSAERLLELERLGLPLDLPSRWPDQIHRITPAEVRSAAKTHLRPERLIEVTIGTG